MLFLSMKMEPQLISSVGIRPGEIILGNGQAAGIKMEVLSTYPYHPPFFPQPTAELLTYLRSLSGITSEDEFEWFRDPTHATNSNDLYMEDADVRVRFLEINNAYFKKSLPEEVLGQLLQGEHRLQDVMNMFPRRPGSKARKVTLIFRPSLWVNVPTSVRQEEFTGIIIDVDAMTISQGHVVNPGILHVFEPQPGYKMAVVAKNGSGIVPNAEGFEPKMTEWFTPTFYKSLIQKIIRTGASYVTYEDKVWHADAVLRYSFETLLMHPGVFVPDIQRFTRGVEAATKRLAVAVIEDAWTATPEVVMSLFAAALLAQVSKTWYPQESTVRRWEQVMYEARSTPYWFHYDSSISYTSLTPHAVSHLILETIRSFQTDIDMMASVAYHNGAAVTSPLPLYERMEITHCLDHHCVADIGYFTDRMPESFTAFNGRGWDKVTGCGPRRGKLIDETDPDVIDYRRCQRLMWLQKSVTPMMREVTGVHRSVSRFPLAMIAGMVGVQEVKVDGITAYAMINPDAITTFNAVARPTREALKTDNPIRLSDEQKDRVVAEFRHQLTQGLTLQDVPATMNRFRGARLVLHEEEDAYSLTIGTETRWANDLFNERVEIPLHTPIAAHKEYALITSGAGMEIGSSATFRQLLGSIRVEVLRRIMVFIDGYHSVIGVYKLSRDGTGQEYTVSPLDAEVMSFFLRVSLIYPGILRKKSGDGFDVLMPSMFWMLRDAVSARINHALILTQPWLYRLDNRRLWQHQTDAIEQMISRVRRNKRGHLMWIPVGMGKTLIVIRLICQLIEMRRLPNYLVYLLPPAAIPTIREEFETHGFRVHEVDARKGSTTADLLPQHVNLLRHNHLILNGMDEKLTTLAGDIFLVLDEFHLLFNPSKRTSVALELATLCRDYVGMTGTLIKNERHDDLIEWLGRVSEFEVTPKNYWVAIGSIVSKQIESHVVTVRQEVKVEAPAEYYTFVPSSLGGTAHRIDMKRAVDACYDAITPPLVAQAVELLKTEPGVFIVAKDRAHQEKIYNGLVAAGVPDVFIHRISGRITTANTGPISLRCDSISNIRVVITTPSYSTSYNMTKFRIRLDSVYFGNQATRDQLDGRMTRICQRYPEVYYLTFHCGILSLVHERYEKTRSISEALKGLAQLVGEDVSLN